MKFTNGNWRRDSLIHRLPCDTFTESLIRSLPEHFRSHSMVSDHFREEVTSGATMDSSFGNLERESVDARPISASPFLIKPEEVQDRKDLVKYLSQSLMSEYHQVRDGELRQNSTFVKSYLVEANESQRTDNTEGWNTFFARTERTTDPGLLRVFDYSGTAFFVDVRDNRFCILHSIAKTEATDKIIKLLADGSTEGFDRAWFPTQFLFHTHIGYLRGFKFSHQPLAQGVTITSGIEPRDEEPVYLPNEDEDFEEELPKASPAGATPRVGVSRSSRSSMTVKDSTTALPDYRAIRDQKVFQARRSLDWIQYEARTQKGDEINHSVYSNGKITANGTSIRLHLHGVEQILSAYSHVIREIEDNHGMGWVNSGKGRRLAGEPLLIRFSDNVEVFDLTLFAKSIFRAAKPYRLFGYPHNVGSNRLDIEAIDLHTGDEFSVEMTKRWMRIFLPRSTCGNVMARLLTNIQHAMDSETILLNGGGEIMFSGGLSHE